MKLLGPRGNELGTTELTNEADILAWAQPLLAADKKWAEWLAVLAKAPAEWTELEAATWKAAWKAEEKPE